MHVDITEYTQKKNDYLRDRRACSVYLVSPSENDSPCKIGIARNLRHRIAKMQADNWIALLCRFVLWCPGSEAAKRIEEKMHVDFYSQRLAGEWFSIDWQIAKEALILNAASLYPTVKFMTHDEVIKKLKQKYLEKRDHVA